MTNLRSQTNLRALSLSTGSEWEFLRWNEYMGSGMLRSYRADIVVVDPRYDDGIIVIEGSGSASKDNEKRDT